MKKIISLFARNYETDFLVRDEVVPGAEWVLAGEGVATRKFDGMCTRIYQNALWRRHEVKLHKMPSEHWVPAQECADPQTGNWMGWVPVHRSHPSDTYLREAFRNFKRDFPDHNLIPETTCEFLGPKSQGNIESFFEHTLYPHEWAPILIAPRDFAGIREYLAGRAIEGIVWHHPDGRMVKIKGRDFGLRRGVRL